MLAYHKEFAVLPKIDCEKLVVVVTYNRKDCINKWLKAYNNAEKYGTKIAVIHAFDGDHPEKSEMENILKHNPEFYIPIFNSNLRDFAALVMVCKEIIPLPNWKHIFWFTDDMLPMRKTFLRPFVEKIAKEKTGLVAQCYEPKSTTGAGGHIRTVAYATKKEITKKFEFPKYDTFDPRCGHEFEFGRNHIMKQIQKMGYNVELCHSAPEADNYQHWTSFLDWMWDCHLLESWKEYWDIYEEQFKPIQRLENVSGKVETLLSQGECEKRTLNPNKISFLIESIESISQLTNCVNSITKHIPKELFQEIIIGINTTDSQKSEDIIEFVKKQNSIVPINYVKFGKKIKSSKVKEQLISMCESQMFALMNDSIKLQNGNWKIMLEQFSSDDSYAMLSWNNCHPTKTKCTHETLELASYSDSFVICKKHILKEINASWESYEINLNFGISNFISYKKFMQWQEKNNLFHNNKPAEDEMFKNIAFPSGSFLIDKILNNNLKICKLETSMICENINIISQEQAVS